MLFCRGLGLGPGSPTKAVPLAVQSTTDKGEPSGKSAPETAVVKGGLRRRTARTTTSQAGKLVGAENRVEGGGQAGEGASGNGFEIGNFGTNVHHYILC